MQYSQSIKNLVAGVSQQPPILRLPEQLEDQINGLSTEVAGLQKRPPTMHILTSGKWTDAERPLFHFVNRDSNERYFVDTIGDGSLYVRDLDGNEKTVTIQEDQNYITVDSPRENLRLITVADYTFIVNRKVKVQMTTKKEPNYFSTQGALIHVKQGQYGRTYSINVNGACIASFTTPDGSSPSHTAQIDTAYIATQLAAKCKEKGWWADCGDCWIRILGTITSLTTQDGFNNQAMIGITSKVQRFSLLPATAPDGYCVEVKGDPNGSDSSSYYVHYVAADRVWEECCAPDIQTEIDASTMPHALIRNADGTFTFKRCSWTERKIGDDDSNPLPSFIGNTINEIFFYRNRLGLLSGENLILSESAEYFNMWMTTANDILDTDCIDIPATTSRINILKYAVEFDSDLYLFSNDAQFILRVDTVLSPKNCALVEVTSFRISPTCRPIVVGKNIYFAAERAEYTSIKEYYNVQNVTDVKNAQDISSHVPSYVPNGVYSIISATDENMMFVLTTGDLSSIYVYKYLFIDDNRVQSSWSKWKFDGVIYGGLFVDSTLYMIIKRGEYVMMEKIQFTYNSKDFAKEPYRTFIDRKVSYVPTYYDSLSELTWVNLASLYKTTDKTGIKSLEVVYADGKYEEIPASNINYDGNFYLKGNHTGETITFGIPYEFKATLSTIYIKKLDNSGGTQSMINGRLQLHEVDINYADTGYFDVTTEHISGRTYIKAMTGKILGTQSSTLGYIPSETGTFKVPIHSLNTQCNITIGSKAPLPVAIVGLVWRGNFIQKSKGV